MQRPQNAPPRLDAGAVVSVHPGRGGVSRHDLLGETELSVSSDLQAATLAAQAEADVKARWAIAQRCPRDWDNVRSRLLLECDRPGFAESSLYTIERGGKEFTGPSIRFAESAARIMGNIWAPTMVIADDMMTRRIRVAVTDLEANVSWPRDISIEKTTERNSVPDGRVVVSQRTNSKGRIVYTIIATEDEVTQKESVAASKALRNGVLRILPADILEDCLERIEETQRKADTKDPAAARKKMMDAFAKLGVMPSQLREYLGVPLEQLPAARLPELRRIHNALRDGEMSWADVMAKVGKREAETSAPKAPPVAAVPSPPAANAAPVTPEAPAPTPSTEQTQPDDDDVEKEIRSILDAIEAATDKKQLTALKGRRDGLPSEADKARVDGAMVVKLNAMRAK